MHQEILNDWVNSRPKVAELNEDDIKALMRQEKAGNCRQTVLVALHQRSCTLRMHRERDALMAFIEKRRARNASRK